MALLAEHEVERALVIIAHPDDADFWAGGTIARWTDAGVAVTYGVLTDGDAGGYDPDVPRDALPGIRRAEQERAATILGVRDVRFFGLPEGGLDPASQELRRQLVTLIRQVRPQRIITWSPEWNWQRFRSCHPDHRATGESTLNAVYPDAGNPFAHRSLLEEAGLKVWTVSEVWLLNSPGPNYFVDVTETFDRKVSAVQAHASQVGNRVNLAEELRRRVAGNTSPAGLASDRLAEAFQVVATG
jgi:LmbE family N-acetylglucosaminyl deacetylase